jgi:hypothetical protein
MHLKILRLSRGLKMQGAVEKLLFTYLWNRYVPPTDSWLYIDSDRCNLHPLMPALTLVSLPVRYLVLETSMPAWRHQKMTVCTFIVYDALSLWATSKWWQILNPCPSFFSSPTRTQTLPLNSQYDVSILTRNHKSRHSIVRLFCKILLLEICQHRPSASFT